MAKRMVTRTIEGTDVTCLCMNIVSAEPCNVTVTLTGKIPSDKLLSRAKAIIDTDEIKAVSVVSVTETKALYKMPEETFISLAEKTIID